MQKWKHSLLFYFWLKTMSFIFGVGRFESSCIEGLNDAHPKKNIGKLKSVHFAESKTPLTLDYQPKTWSFISGWWIQIPPDLKDSVVEISINNMLADISARCQVWNTPYFWFLAKNTEYHLWGWWVQTPLISRSEWQKSEKVRLGLKSVRDAKSETPLTFEFRSKTRNFISGGGGFEPPLI